MRAADLSWEAPPSPFRTTISSTAINCSSITCARSLCSPERANTRFLNRERTPPPKPPLTAILSLTRFTLYTLLVRILPWQRACQLSKPETAKSSVHFLKDFREFETVDIRTMPSARTSSIRLGHLSARYSLVFLSQLLVMFYKAAGAVEEGTSIRLGQGLH